MALFVGAFLARQAESFLSYELHNGLQIKSYFRIWKRTWFRTRPPAHIFTPKAYLLSLVSVECCNKRSPFWHGSKWYAPYLLIPVQYYCLAARSEASMATFMGKFFYTKIFAKIVSYINFLHRNFCIFLHQNVFFLHEIFAFLHHSFKQNFYFLYTKNFAFLAPIFYSKF